ncbi:hypothetical protein DCAR_0729577 [Daucus carota subsp. sativus]|uniref:Signal peptidase complex catalytic subunit SEC11 n=1 Tax=Daucus carota subsp. sativus TaxID=79200 RepID=A0AAF1B8G9_DAUCS|nr:hypothetical protein DCAR_0729577 [Daucus carota subsp. sativus]
MGWIGEQVDSVKSIQFIKFATQTISLGMIVTLALIIWKGLMCVTGGESPVVVLSGSMEPGFKRGDILFLHMSKDPIRREISIVHRVIKGVLNFKSRKITGLYFYLFKFIFKLYSVSGFWISMCKTRVATSNCLFLPMRRSVTISSKISNSLGLIYLSQK